MAQHPYRRKCLKTIAVIGWVSLLGPFLFSVAEGKTADRPDIIFIYTDQQSASMMSCAGNSWLQTPGMDSIAQNGIRFTRAYTTNPVCSPARVGIMTGRFPGSFTNDRGALVRDNPTSMKIPDISDEVRNTTIAAHLKRAGYELVYGGKEHLPKPLTPASQGFEDLTNDQRDQLAEVVANYIRREHDRPYFLWVNLINPHDICYMALRGLTFDKQSFPPGKRLSEAEKTLLKAMKLPDGVSATKFLAKRCPPLPPNFEPQQGEPKAIDALLKQRAFRIRTRQQYSERDWRLHRWAYCRLTEMVDQQVQTILDAVRESGRQAKTLVIFSSDHGDMDSVHRMEHKTALYEPAANVPFLAMYKGHIPAGRVDNTHLVSSGLDLLPTVCDYAGIQGKADPRGRSLRPLLEGREVPWRETLGVESEIGRMVVDQDGCKYIRYDFVPNLIEEQLLDLKADPGETRHFTNDPAYAAKLKGLRQDYDTRWFPGQ